MTIGYIGSYTKQDGKGIYRFSLNEETQKIETVETAYETPGSTYVTIHGDYMYGLTKIDEDAGVQSYKIKEDGTLELINNCLKSKENGCHLSVSHDGKYLFEAVYGAGEARLYSLNPETGEIINLIDTTVQEGLGPNEDRQDKAHTHFITETPDQKYAVAVDLGADEVITFTYGEEGLKRVHALKVPAGVGPRHLVFNANGKYAYLFTELSNDVFVLSYQEGQFEIINQYHAIPNDYTKNSQGAAIRMSQDNQYVYVSNRGHNSITSYKVESDGSALSFVETVSCGGDWPRDFNISDDDQYLVCAHEVSSNITVFKRDTATGKLTQTDAEQQAAEGVCVQFL